MRWWIDPRSLKITSKRLQNRAAEIKQVVKRTGATGAPAAVFAPSRRQMVLEEEARVPLITNESSVCMCICVCVSVVVFVSLISWLFCAQIDGLGIFNVMLDVTCPCL